MAYSWRWGRRLSSDHGSALGLALAGLYRRASQNGIPIVSFCGAPDAASDDRHPARRNDSGNGATITGRRAQSFFVNVAPEELCGRRGPAGRAHLSSGATCFRWCGEDFQPSMASRSPTKSVSDEDQKVLGDVRALAGT